MGVYFFFQEMYDKLFVFEVLTFCLEVLGQISDVGQHEVASFGYDRSEADLHEELGQVISLQFELGRNCLEIAVLPVEAFEFKFNAASDNFLEVGKKMNN